jgi:subtilisin family serine protease
MPLDNFSRDMQMKDAHDFVYMKDAGKDVYVYVIDVGVNLEVNNVSKPVEQCYSFTDRVHRLMEKKNLYLTGVTSFKHKQVLMKGENKKDDHAPNIAESHGTLVASKAVGRKYGVAKQVRPYMHLLDRRDGDGLSTLSFPNIPVAFVGRPIMSRWT